ncbi:PIG-L deacetylase family protein [Dyella sp. 2RAB6]|uniref:PIG-L deacetylase family protein n=1 Tax=Dyella sp. 2RAB6 TaxID=3232992 RepID=UPI003F93EC5F
MPVTIDAHTRLLVVAPHPDDESIATGELIQHVRAAGGTVEILLLTAGDNNPWPQRWLERRLRIGSDDRRRWGARRRQEVTGALARLGLPQEALHPLGLPDMGLTACLREDLHGQVSAWAGWLERCRPNLIAVPALGDGHPDHSAAHVLLRLAVAQWREAGQGEPPVLLSYLVHGQAADHGEAVALPSSADMHAAKLAALDQHQSQVALSGGRMRGLAGRPEVFRTVEPAGSGGWLPWQPSAAQRPWLRLTLADREGARSWPWSKAPLERDAAGRWRLALDATPGPRFVKLYTGLPSLWIFDRWGWCEL